MSISTRIEAIEQHLTDDYNVLEVAGADLTNVDKNILNLKTTWQERLLYFMNNGTDVVWNNWDKVTGEGTSISLNNTLEGKMKIVLKGNTSQEGTPTPETPQDIHVVSGDNSIDICGKNLISNDIVGSVSWSGTTVNYEGTSIKISKSGTGGIGANAHTNIRYFPLITGKTYTFSMNYKSGTIVTEGASYGWAFYIYGVNKDGSTSNSVGYRWTCELPKTATMPPNHITFTPDKDFIGFKLGCYIPGSSLKTNGDVYFDCQVEVGEATTYEPYQSASYPISLGVENLFDDTLELGSINGSGYNVVSTTDLRNVNYISVKPNTTYTISIPYNTRIATRYYNASKVFLSTGTTTQKTYTFTTPNECYYARFSFLDQTDINLSVELVEGSTPQRISTTPIELCKIGDYQDRFIRNSGKNKMPLLNGSATLNGLTITIENGIVTINGTASNGATFKLSNGIEGVSGASINDNWLSQLIIKNKKNYTISVKYLGGTGATSGCAFRLYSNTSTYLNQFYPLTQEQSLTYPDDGKISLITFFANPGSTFTNYKFAIQLEEGSSVTDFEPYGNGDWYLNKQIGKVVLDGSESWTNYTNLGNNSRCYYIKPNAFSLNSQLFSNYFIKSNLYETDETGIIINPYGTSLISIKIPNSDLETQDLAGYKTWLGTHNTIVYYVLATPTYTKIEGELLSQLNALAKSYNSQTNISQDNNDLASILNATALREMS